MKSLIIKILVALSFSLMIIVNALANTLPINNITTGEVSDLYPNLFAPAGITFSIWGIIYLMLGLFVLYQFGIFQNIRSKQKLFDKIGIIFIFNAIANVLWIISWHYDYIALSLILMIIILITLIKISELLRKEKLNSKEYFFILLPFSIYFGWITVATIANVTVLLVSLGWNGFNISEEIWTVIIIFIGSLIGILTTLRLKNIPYGLVFIWAYTGIIIKHVSYSGFGGEYFGVIIASFICILLFISSLVFVNIKNIHNNKISSP